MKKIFTLVFIALTAFVYAQSINIQNMNNALRNKDYAKGKVAADEAAVHESTKSSAKMFMYRGNVYKAIYSDTSKAIRDLDVEAEEKALESYINCLKNDNSKVYIDNVNSDNVKSNMIASASATKRKARIYISNKEYDKALYCFDLLEQALPFDSDQSLKRQNVTKEILVFEKFEMYKSAGNKDKIKEFANKLIDMNYKDVKIYTDMVKISLNDKDTTAALSYIEKGKVMFEENMNLISTEIDIYMARKKTDVLKDKLKAAIEVAPDNEILHLVLANLYGKTGKFEDAEKEYLKSLELKPDYEPANYNLGALYYGQAKDWNDKLNALGLKDPKTKEYESKSNEFFKKSVGYFESSYEITKDANTKKILRQITLRLGDTEKAEKYK
ncbi:tetratricopeptide repeat protein [Aurantibacillus circumpalustris]|uniref:tetratricopeptide repeat protein n=1 Tax=Aurantibacillus circumpalustris TaxID=3036359 RepID=UPI00295AFB9B|nr:tetratricopeptide repeat protein [Aurantibacillus circumpalustris]